MSNPEPGNSNGTQPSSTANNATNNRLKQTQAQVDEVVGIMRVNVEKVLERDQKLSELDQRADALQHGASQFEQQASKLKRKQWWANMKMMIIMGVIGVVLLIIIIQKTEQYLCLSGSYDVSFLSYTLFHFIRFLGKLFDNLAAVGIDKNTPQLFAILSLQSGFEL
ncbi:synaptobrevin-1-like isoform X2 [Anopheles albimanus]|uniref:synaptobrevin-1-like isoform X2 n=1 Tax=Anopheles albimanus TaxID=7167 RepID=UPI00163F85E1|nr:synaptobrevin-1-like isoform X2 [Anopheles albimanus]XP_035789348.1 synaptobrevin-1-like isoform X2 [Anopheles albimanus]XP_035789349.1 synaptobrevin-1-like isoform X2 [Anopheles albimanus]